MDSPESARALPALNIQQRVAGGLGPASRLADDGSAEHADGGGPTISAGLFFFFFAVRRQTVDNTALEVVAIHNKPPPLLIVRRRISTKPRLLVCSSNRGC